MATLTELLPLLQEHSSILVTGPQRSGTTIGARVLATELVLRYVDEHDVRIDNVAKARAVLAEDGVVLQAPGLCYMAHTFGCAVVLMRRPVADIIRSQQRVGWGRERHELAKYETTVGPIADVKYRAWDEWQREQCVAAYELDYDSLGEHGLWVNPEQRRAFGPRQWRVC